jgi:protein transport protein SEC24
MIKQLILPETFKLLPLLTLMLLKTKVFRAGAHIGSDLRVFYMRQLYSMSVPESVPYFYPRMFQLHNLEDPVCFNSGWEGL